MKPSNLRKYIDWTGKNYEFGTDADEDSKHNQKNIKKGSQELYEIISDKEIEYGGREWAFY